MRYLPGFEVHCDARDRGRLSLHGELDRTKVPRLMHALGPLEGTGRRLTLDLRELDFVDAGGLRAIHQAGRRAAEGGWRFVIVNPSAWIRRILALTALDHSLHIVHEREPHAATIGASPFAAGRRDAG